MPPGCRGSVRKTRSAKVMASDRTALTLVWRQLADVLGEHQGKRGKGGRVQVGRIRRGDLTHRLGKTTNAGRQIAVGEQCLDGSAVRPLPRRARFGQSRVTRGCESIEGAPGRRHIILAPEQVAVGHRFPPERHRERRIGLLRLAEIFRGFLGTRSCAAARDRAGTAPAPRGHRSWRTRPRRDLLASCLPGACAAPASPRSQSVRG